MRTGRPREFDADKAIEKAMRVFWKKGYEGATLADLTRAMGINRPSMYAAFGNKQQLFNLAVDRYSAENGPVACLTRAMQQPTAKAVARAWLTASVDLLTCPKNPRGCFMVQAAMAGGDDAQEVRKDLIHRRKQAEAQLRKRFVRAAKDGDFPASAYPADLARYITTVTAGMSVQAASGATRAQLLALVDTAMRAWR